MYEEGRGVLKDEAKAFFWYGQSAVAGNARGMVGLAKMYEEGRGTAKDTAKASHWRLRAAAAGR
jgi:TPR repeat protein